MTATTRQRRNRMPTYGMRYQIPAMLEAGGGSIINVASILGSVGFPNAAAYYTVDGAYTAQ